MTHATFYGWNEKQWDDAIKYFNLCHKDKATALDAGEMFKKLEEEMKEGPRAIPATPKDAIMVMRFWKEKRIDNPGQKMVELISWPI